MRCSYNMLQGSWCQRPRLLLRLEDMAFLAETDHDIVVGELTCWGGSNSHNMMVQVLLSITSVLSKPWVVKGHRKSSICVSWSHHGRRLMVIPLSWGFPSSEGWWVHHKRQLKTRVDPLTHTHLGRSITNQAPRHQWWDIINIPIDRYIPNMCIYIHLYHYIHSYPNSIYTDKYPYNTVVSPLSRPGHWDTEETRSDLADPEGLDPSGLRWWSMFEILQDLNAFRECLFCINFEFCLNQFESCWVNCRFVRSHRFWWLPQLDSWNHRNFPS
jgi:hypothetical protein